MLYSTLYLVWTLVNFALVIYFIRLCFGATKFIKEKHGLLVSIFFIIGLFSIMAKPNTSNIVHNNKLLNLSEEDVDHTKLNSSKYFTIQKMGLSSFNIEVSYGSFKSSPTPLPYEAYSSISGLVGAHEWEPKIIVNKTSKPGHFQYYVHGMLQWKLLGIRLYSQPKSYSGFFDIP